MSDEYQVFDGSGDRRYFTQIPNIVFDYPFSPYAFRVYAHIKKVAGEDGMCWQSTRTIADYCNISAPSVTRAIRELEKAGVIQVKRYPYRPGENARTEIWITDIWQENMNYFSLGQDERSAQRDEWKKAVSMK
ncbi:MAG: winged helix-turn-helix transcriptional regulator [Chloroflexi bacterium]|nr:winged helix-turn-helix transcriptional regulator [Chloroflexota bacterium]